MSISGPRRQRPSAIEEATGAFLRANLGRDQVIYQEGLNAADISKAASMIRHLRVPEGGSIKDIGSGTGRVTEIIARHFSRAAVYGLDLSHELLEAAEHGRRLMLPVFGNARTQHFRSNSLDAVCACTAFHEIKSFGGIEAVREALRVSHQELKPGGMIVIRDMLIPDDDEPVYLLLPDHDGLSEIPAGVPHTELDYTALSTLRLFKCFHEDFAGGNAFQYRTELIDGRSFVVLPPEWAYEFYMRKDYRKNYRNEIHEKYGPWRIKEGIALLQEAGFHEVAVHEETNEWIVTNRLAGKVGLYRRNSAGELELIPFYTTHATFVAKKPGALQQPVDGPPYNLTDYRTILSQIKIDDSNGTISVGDETFAIEIGTALHGTKRSVFYLQDDSRYVLKVPRLDGQNPHNCFKAMYQTIARGHVLQEYEVPHLPTVRHDQKGPPYRYLLQERLPADAECAADLILMSALREQDIEQMAAIVNRFELRRQFQVDTNPYNWYRLTRPNGSTQMVYADGKVYPYDDAWSFTKKGLLQWLLPDLLPGHSAAVKIRCAEIPLARLSENYAVWWHEGIPTVTWWRRYLHPSLQPSGDSTERA